MEHKVIKRSGCYWVRDHFVALEKEDILDGLYALHQCNDGLFTYGDTIKHGKTLYRVRDEVYRVVV